MARGYPDFFGNPIFPSYGNILTSVYDAFNVAIGATSTLVSISAKGRIQGGWLYVSSTDISGDGIAVEFDEQIEYKRTMGGVGIVWWEGSDQPIRLKYYNTDNTTAGFTFQPDWVFGQSFKLYYENNGAAIVSGTIEVIYNVVA